MSVTPPLLPWLHEPLHAALNGANGHALLVHGPQGVGQFDFSLALARSWLCEAPGREHRPQVACGVCPSCHLVQARSHPDLVVVLPEALQAALGWAGEDEAEAAEKSGKTRKPSQEIKVEAIRAVVQFSQHTASRGRAKVIVIHPAERMNTVSSNTLLKTLEEPPGLVRFVISAGALDDILPTVRSRCQAWRLPLPPVHQAVAWLKDEAGLAREEDAALLLQAAGGQPLTALERHALGLAPSQWPQIPAHVVKGQAGPMAGWPLPLVIETLQKLCHDLACRAVGSEARYFPSSCLPAVGTVDRLTAWAKELRKAYRQAEHPWNASLRLEALLLQARQVLKAR